MRILLALLLLAAVARAEDPPAPRDLSECLKSPVRQIEPLPPPAVPSDWHVGLNVRPDVGTHPIRFDGGVRTNGWDFILVVDPMFWTDGQTDTDLFVAKRSEAGWQALAGWRLTTIGMVDGSQKQEKLLVGLGGDLPKVSDSFRATWGFELAALLVKHGGDLPTETIGFKSGRFYIDLLNFGMFVRFEYAGAFTP